MVTESHLDIERQKPAREYATLTKWLTFFELLIIATLLLVLIFGGVSVKLSSFIALPQPWAAALYFIILAIGLGVITMPLDYYQGFILSHRYGLSNERFSGWLTDRGKASALAITLALIIVTAVYWLLVLFPDTWWLRAGILLILVSLLLTRLTPTLLISLFFKLEPLNDLELETRLRNMAERTNTRVCGIFTIDLSSKNPNANAMLAGLGNTRRIILIDTLVKNYSDEEIEVILAHELGHHVHRDTPKMIALQTGIILLGFYLADLALKASIPHLAFDGIAGVATLPLLILSVAAFSLAITPLINTHSRHLENSADSALELTTNPYAFITVMSKLTDQNLAEAQPSRWVELLFYDHPPYTRRVNSARNYIQENA